MNTLCRVVEDQEIKELTSVVKKVWEKFKDTESQTRYGFRVNIDDIKESFPELQILKQKYPNKDNLLRFMITDRRDRGIHIDFPDYKLIPDVLIFPVTGCNFALKTRWYELIEGEIGIDKYNIFVKMDAEYQANVIHSHAIREPVIFNTRVWHGLINETKEFRVMARWWTE